MLQLDNFVTTRCGTRRKTSDKCLKRALLCLVYCLNCIVSLKLMLACRRLEGRKIEKEPAGGGGKGAECGQSCTGQELVPHCAGCALLCCLCFFCLLLLKLSLATLKVVYLRKEM